MSNRQPNAFRRAFPVRESFRGSARSVLVWTILNSLLLVFLIVTLFLILDLLNHRGRITVWGKQNVLAIQTLRNNVPLVDPSSPANSVKTSAHNDKEEPAKLSRQAANNQQPAPASQTLVLTDTGILPSLWWLHSSYSFNIFDRPYQRFPVLQENQSALFSLIFIALILASLRVMIRWRVRQRSLKISQHVSMTLRNMIHRQALRLGPGDLSGKETDQTFSLFTKDVGVVQTGVFQWIYRLSQYSSTLLVLVLFTILVDWRLTLQCMIPLGAAWYFLQQYRKDFELQRARTMVSIESELSLLAENVRSTRLVRGYGMETSEHEHFQKHLEKYSQNIDNLKRVEGWGHRIARSLAVFCSCLVLFLVGYKVLVNPIGLPLSAAVLMVMIFAFFYIPVNGLYGLISIHSEANVSASSIYRFLNKIPEVSQAVGAKFLEPLSQSLQFENVSYSLSGQETKVLDGFDLKIPAGISMAFVSLEGLSPRAVTYLIPRFIEPKSGRILMDGEDTAWVTLESLRAEAIYVSGNDPCLTGTVKENIRCGDERFSLQEIIAASKETHAHQFIQNLPQGYETVLGQHGEDLTTGENFRLGLARALLRKPALMIVEEPEGALDEDTKTLLEDAYSRIFQDRTILMIPSRIATLRRVDQVVLIHEGKVEAIDSQSDLLKKSALYRHWEYTRFNQFRHSQESAN